MEATMDVGSNPTNGDSTVDASDYETALINSDSWLPYDRARVSAITGL